MTIDWTKPIEMLDGTRLHVTAGPDFDGDYWVARDDGGRIKSINKDSIFKDYEEMCVHPNGKFEGCQHLPIQVRNVK